MKIPYFPKSFQIFKWNVKSIAMSMMPQCGIKISSTKKAYWNYYCFIWNNLKMLLNHIVFHFSCTKSAKSFCLLDFFWVQECLQSLLTSKNCSWQTFMSETSIFYFIKILQNSQSFKSFEAISLRSGKKRTATWTPQQLKAVH